MATTISQKISPFLWFDTQAEEAVNFYTSIFKDSGIHHITRYSKQSSQAARMPEGSVMTIAFTLNGQNFTAINGGPVFKFTEAISFVVTCHNQEELDNYWTKLSEGGEEQSCGWLKDKFGLSWQVIPEQLTELISQPVKSGKVMEALLKMKKIIIKDLEEAARA